jgi:hypothetical protein
MGQIENGRYDAFVVESALGESTNGHEQIAIRLQIDDERFPDHQGKQCVYYGYFTEGAMEHTVNALKACGFHPDVGDFADLDGGDVIKGTLVSITVEWEEYQGKDRLRVQWINTRGGPMCKTALDEKKTGALGARVSALMKGQGKAVPAAKRATEKIAVDDTPF